MGIKYEIDSNFVEEIHNYETNPVKRGMCKSFQGSAGGSSPGEVRKDFTKEVSHELNLRIIRENEENITDRMKSI